MSPLATQRLPHRRQGRHCERLHRLDGVSTNPSCGQRGPLGFTLRPEVFDHRAGVKIALLAGGHEGQHLGAGWLWRFFLKLACGKQDNGGDCGKSNHSVRLGWKLSADVRTWLPALATRPLATTASGGQ